MASLKPEAELNWIIGPRSKLPLKLKVVLYKQLIASIWKYAIPIWGALICESRFNKLQVEPNKILRKITGAPWYVSYRTLHSDLEVNVYDKLCFKYVSRLLVHPNSETGRIGNYPYIPQRLQWKHYSLMLNYYLQSTIFKQKWVQILTRGDG